MVAQSSVFPIFLRAEYREGGSGFARFQSDAQRAAAAAKSEFQGVQAALDQALSRNRNSGGSLDLGVDELRQAAAAQQQVAVAAREVAEATRRAATANGQFDASMSRATRAAFELANAEERASRELLEQVAALEAVQRELDQTASATDLVTAANRRGTTATSNVINSQRASRTAFIQLGQQLQDVAVQAQLGTNAFIIFGQQVPQAAFALSGLADSTNKTAAAVGRFATFMSGPFGAAIFIAIAALGPLVQKMFESEEAADASGRAQRSLTEVLSDVTSSYEEVTEALDDYIRSQERSREVTIAELSNKASVISSNLREAASIREKTKARIEDLQAAEGNLRATGDRGAFAFGAEADGLQPVLDRQNKEIEKLIRGAGEVRIEVADEIARINSSAEVKITEGFRLLKNQARATITDVGELSKRLTELNRQEAAAKEAAGRGGGRSSRQSSRREVDQSRELARVSQQAAERVNQINDRFAAQTRLVTQSLQANRELDSIIADTNRRLTDGTKLTAAQRKEFEKIVNGAEAARKTIDEALKRPFEDLTRESNERLEIERLLAQGRIDEAAGLQAVLQLQRQIGTEVELRAALERAIKDNNATEADRIRGVLSDYNERIEAARDTVIQEQRITRELRDQQAVFEAQVDVVQTVRRDLTDLLSGRSADFFGNFRQALQDLQGQRLFEDLFGQAFHDIEEQLRGNTPQGRANAAYTANVNETGDTTKRLEVALDGLTTAVSTTRDRLLSDFDTEFARAANDNTVYQGQITVTGKRGIPDEFKIARRSTKEIADQISKATVAGFLEPLRDVLGEKFFNGLSTALGGVLSAFVRGGTPGAVLQGGSEIAKLFKGGDGIAKFLGNAAGGAETGTQIDGLIKAIGIRGSRTGAQIGGAAGAATGIPGGAQIGAAIGSIVGGLLKGTPRGSATIGGVGGSLGITGTRGNSNRLEGAASDLAGSVLDAIDDIARQLGASVDAARGSVSIGVRNDNLRVDTTGRGITKTDNGAIDFGDDTEAAIAFAVRDLINDGVITGLRQAEQNLIRAGNDIEESLRDVLTFRSVFDRLQEIKDPLGFAIGQLNREFEGLIDLFERAGASTEEFASLEELYNLERARAIEDATDRVAGSLKQLLADLRIGDSGLSLRDRRANALGQFNSLAGRVAAGDSSAFDDFADISQQLLDIERQLFGSTQSYFDRLAEITRLTEAAIADQTNVVSIGSSAPSPFGDPIRVDRSIDIMNGNLGDKLDTLNSNVVTLSEALLRSPGFSGGGGGFSEFSLFPASRANF